MLPKPLTPHTLSSQLRPTSSRTPIKMSSRTPIRDPFKKTPPQKKAITHTLLFLLFLLLTPKIPLAEEILTLRSGWYEHDPYQYQRIEKGRRIQTGLDLELLRLIADRVGAEITFDALTWESHVAGIKNGTHDLAAGATYKEERDAFAYFSLPYRQEVTGFYVSAAYRNLWTHIRGLDELVEDIVKRDIRLGAIRGYVYPDRRINDVIAHPEVRERIVFVDSNKDNIYNLLDGEIDGFFGDRIVVNTITWRDDIQKRIVELPPFASANVSLMFSKKTVSKDIVDRFNRAIAELEREGTFDKVTKRYVFPILLSQTVGQKWFFWVEILGTVAFVFSGLLLAYKFNYDIVGAFVLASLPAVGGGVIRDLTVNRHPIAILQSPLYLCLVLGMVVVGYIGIKIAFVGKHYFQRYSSEKIKRLRKIINYSIAVFDAAGLAAFIVIGVLVALSMEAAPLWLWGPILATITGAGGGILRDVVRSDPDIPSLRGSFYPEVAVIWGSFLSFFLILQGSSINPEAIVTGVNITMLGAFVTRMMAHSFQWKSPMFS